MPAKVLLGVSGGIAAYKSADLVRRLKERNFEVRVVMTKAARKFTTSMTLQAVSGQPVHCELFESDSDAAMDHIQLAKWADILLIAPATANILAKIAHGIADDLLTTLILATQAKLFVAPAMNQQMWLNQATITNVEILKQRDVKFLGPDSGEQACGDLGFGRMLEPLIIAEKLVTLANGEESSSGDKTSNVESMEIAGILKDKKVLITAGPTREAIDPVRYISNHSSGKMGYALAMAAIEAGAVVSLISGPVDLERPKNIVFKSVISAGEMFEEVKNQVSNCDIFIGCAAVADYTPSETAQQKIKKSADEMSVSLVKNPDIIAWVAEQDDRPFIVGFAAETRRLEEYAKRKLETKMLDMICANDVSNGHTGFNSDHNKILILDKQGERCELATASKLNIARDIIKQISQKI